MIKANFLFDLTDKVAVITGSGQGLGKAMVLVLADAGASVVVCGRTEYKLKQVAAEIESRGGQALTHTFDACDRQHCEALVAATMNRFGKLDVMVVNHGVSSADAPAAEHIQEQQWRYTVENNLTGCFNCAQLAGRQMIAQKSGGSIILVSSTASLVGFRGLTDYAASKGGVDQLCRQLALEWGQYKIRVNAVNPGYTENMMAGSERRKTNTELEAEIYRMTPLQRRGRAEEIAAPVVFLASDAASFVSGVVLPVDGGYCAY